MVKSAKSPFKLLEYYTEEDTNSYAGREDDIAAVVRHIFQDRHFVLYGRSGLGKTSLLRAGVFPRLRARGFFPIILRTLEDPIAELGQALSPHFEEGAEVPEPIFERLCALHDQLQTPIVLVLDQFEEIFTRFRDRPELRRPFLKLLAQAIADDSMDLRVVFSLREDYLAEFHALSKAVPGVGKNAYRLEPLTRFGARLAITTPLKVANISYDKRLIGALLEELASQNYDPPLLQVACGEIYEAYRNDTDVERMTRDHLHAVGGFDGIMERYLRRTVDAVPTWLRLIARVLLDCLFTREGTKLALSQDKLQESMYIRRTAQEESAVLEVLIEQRLVRKSVRRGVDWYELNHDSIVPILRAWLPTDTEFLEFGSTRRLVANLTEGDLWRTDHELLLSDRQLERLIAPYRERLAFGATNEEFLVRSALVTGSKQLAFWAERYGMEATAEIAGQFLESDETAVRQAILAALPTLPDRQGVGCDRALALMMQASDESERDAATRAVASLMTASSEQAVLHALETAGSAVSERSRRLGALLLANKAPIDLPWFRGLMARVHRRLNFPTPPEIERSARGRSAAAAAIVAGLFWSLTTGGHFILLGFGTFAPTTRTSTEWWFSLVNFLTLAIAIFVPTSAIYGYLIPGFERRPSWRSPPEWAVQGTFLVGTILVYLLIPLASQSATSESILQGLEIDAIGSTQVGLLVLWPIAVIAVTRVVRFWGLGFFARHPKWRAHISFFALTAAVPQLIALALYLALPKQTIDKLYFFYFLAFVSSASAYIPGVAMIRVRRAATRAPPKWLHDIAVTLACLTFIAAFGYWFHNARPGAVAAPTVHAMDRENAKPISVWYPGEFWPSVEVHALSWPTDGRRPFGVLRVTSEGGNRASDDSSDSMFTAKSVQSLEASRGDLIVVPEGENRFSLSNEHIPGQLGKSAFTLIADPHVYPKLLRAEMPKGKGNLIVQDYRGTIPLEAPASLGGVGVLRLDLQVGSSVFSRPLPAGYLVEDCMLLSTLHAKSDRETALLYSATPCDLAMPELATTVRMRTFTRQQLLLSTATSTQTAFELQLELTLKIRHNEAVADGDVARPPQFEDVVSLVFASFDPIHPKQWLRVQRECVRDPDLSCGDYPRDAVRELEQLVGPWLADKSARAEFYGQFAMPDDSVCTGDGFFDSTWRSWACVLVSLRNDATQETDVPNADAWSPVLQQWLKRAERVLECPTSIPGQGKSWPLDDAQGCLVLNEYMQLEVPAELRADDLPFAMPAIQLAYWAQNNRPDALCWVASWDSMNESRMTVLGALIDEGYADRAECLGPAQANSSQLILRYAGSTESVPEAAKCYTVPANLIPGEQNRYSMWTGQARTATTTGLTCLRTRGSEQRHTVMVHAYEVNNSVGFADP